MTNTYRLRLLGSTLLSAAVLAGAPAAAQTENPPAMTTGEQASADQAAAVGEDVVVTGSLIRNPNLEQATPVIATTSEMIELKQSNLAEEVLREIPGVVANMGSAMNNGNTGVSYVDLRGLGSIRNIVLLDGKRIVPNDSTGRVDLNVIPLALLERVDSLTGAAVTTYGADAVTGVINFITRRNFEGVELLASNQITEKGDGHYFRFDATIGGNFGDGRGNAVVSLGYQDSDPVYQSQRDFSVFSIDSFSNTVQGSGTTVPSRFSGTRPLNPATGLPSTDPTVLNGGLRRFDPTTGNAVTAFPSFNFNPFNIFQTPFERFNIFGQAHYEVADGIEVYGRGMYAKTSVDTIVAPSGAFGTPVQINLNNPFLQAGLRRQFCGFDVNPSAAVYTARFSAAECDAAALATGSSDPRYRVVGAGGVKVPFDINGDGVISPGEEYDPNPGITLNRRTTELGPRVQQFRLDTFDIRAGVRGSLTSTLDWDINGSYGQQDNTLSQNGYVVASRLKQGLLVNGTRANPVCNNTANGCVPIDVFGVGPLGITDGTISTAAAGFLTADAFAFRGARLVQAQGLITGDIGVALPSAVQPIGVALGVEYRNYYGYQDADFLSRTAGELGGAGGAIIPFEGRYDVHEVYGEVIAPLVEDKPFFESLTLEGGLRYSKYSIQAAGDPGYDTWTYKAGLSWEPGAGFKLRGNYSRAARAPNLFELFNPPATGLTNLGIDPCAGAAPTSNANLRAICLAQGAPVGTIGSINNPSAAQANITNQGNVNLQPEKATTWTVGAVFQPEFLSGFNLSVDYYNIKVKEAIGQPLVGDLVGACFGNISAASAASTACTVIRRNPITGALDGDQSISPGLFAQTDNLGRLSTDGIDLLANYRTDLGAVRLDLSFVGNWTNSSKFQASASALNRECVGQYSVNCSFTGSIQPEFQFSQRSTLTFGDASLSLLWRWIDRVEFERQQFDEDVAGALGAPADCPNPLGADPGACVIDPEFRQISARSYFDLTARYRVTENFTFTMTVQNLLDKQPPEVGNTIGSTSFNSGNTYPSTYDALGRRFAVSGKVTF